MSAMSLLSSSEHCHVTGHVTSMDWGQPLDSKMAPPRVSPSRRKDESKDDTATCTDDGDFFQFAPLPLSIAIVILLIFYWVSV